MYFIEVVSRSGLRKRMSVRCVEQSYTIHLNDLLVYHAFLCKFICSCKCALTLYIVKSKTTTIFMNIIHHHYSNSLLGRQCNFARFKLKCEFRKSGWEHNKGVNILIVYAQGALSSTDSMTLNFSISEHRYVTVAWRGFCVMSHTLPLVYNSVKTPVVSDVSVPLLLLFVVDTEVFLLRVFANLS